MTTARIYVSLALLFALVPSAGGATAVPIAYIDLPRLVADHPMHAALTVYDREIAALRGTQTQPETAALAADADRGATALHQDAAAARLHAERIATTAPARDRARERADLAAIVAAQRTGDRGMGLYARELASETNANLTAFAQSIAERNARAFAAREQQLRERELARAFDLERASAGTRLLLRLKLEQLHPDRSDRARLQRELSALDTHESKEIAVMRGGDAVTLAAYRNQLQRDGATAEAQMSEQLRAKALANLQLRRRVLHASFASTTPASNVTGSSSFAAGYRAEDDASSIGAGMRAASGDVAQRFAQLAQSARQSQRETAGEIDALQSQRNALYRSIVGQIVQQARLIARQRGLRGLDTAGSAPAGSVDLTGAVRAALQRF